MNILVPVDFGEEAEVTKDFAAAVAKLSEGKVIFLHTVPPTFIFASDEQETASTEIRGAEFIMKKYVKELNEAGITASYVITEEYLTNAVESIVLSNGIDLIIMCTKGAKGLQKILVGSNASAVLNEIDVPVLFIPKDAEFSKLEKIVITLEKAADASNYLKKVLSLTHKWGLEYDILHFSSNADEDLDDFSVKHVRALEKMYSEKIFSRTNLFSSNIQEGLKLYQAEHPEAMLVMLSAHKSIWEKYFSKSDTEEMVYHPNIPLLVIKEEVVS